MSTEAVFIDCSVRQLQKMLERIDACVLKIPEEKLWLRGGENQNAVGNLLLHLEGNVRQWILHGVFGQPDHRDRNAEFAAQGGRTGQELLQGLRATVEEASALVSGMPHNVLEERIRPQGYDVTKLEAIYHVVEHFTGHAFQIIFVTKMLTGEDLGFYGHLSKK